MYAANKYTLYINLCLLGIKMDSTECIVYHRPRFSTKLVLVFKITLRFKLQFCYPVDSMNKQINPGITNFIWLVINVWQL